MCAYRRGRKATLVSANSRETNLYLKNIIALWINCNIILVYAILFLACMLSSFKCSYLSIGNMLWRTRLQQDYGEMSHVLCTMWWEEVVNMLFFRFPCPTRSTWRITQLERSSSVFANQNYEKQPNVSS